MHVLLVNAGSSSLKVSLLDAQSQAIVAHGAADWAGSATHWKFTGPGGQVDETVPWRGPGPAVERTAHDLHVVPGAVGHRVVHGGSNTHALRVDAAVHRQLKTLVDLAPLHNPPSMEALAAAEKLWPKVPHVVAFDTTFHATLPPAAYTYPLPSRWSGEWGYRKYGFHGLSHSYAARRSAQMLKRDDLRLVVCHLGHGCSASAIAGGKCVDTSMGYTPLDGLMMGTRSGSVDPSILIHVQRHHGLSIDQVETALLRESGLLGVSGKSGDMRTTLDAEAAGDPAAALAVEIDVHRVRQTIGAYAATLGGIDVLVFTGGVGENSAEIRRRICDRLGFLGIDLDRTANEQKRCDADIATAASKVRILILEAREDLSMLHDVMEVLEGRPSLRDG
jgi:acetate kinase